MLTPNILRLIRRYGPVALLIVNISAAIAKLVNEVFFYPWGQRTTNTASR